MSAIKTKLEIEFDVNDLPTLTEIFKKFKVKTKVPRPSADEIEQLIIKKALRDAKAIDNGTLKTKSFNTIADLMSDLKFRPLDEFLSEMRAESIR